MAQMFELRELIGAEAPENLRVAGITADSRKAAADFAFFAIAGAKADGARFANDAVARGVSVVIGEGERPAELLARVPYVRVADVRRALALAASRVFPAQPQTIIAVTGTNGKTSVASFVRQIWAATGAKAASIGTIGLVSPNGETSGSLTTPDPLSLHELLDRLARECVTHMAMEASSHGLDQRRLDGVRLAAGAFTNLTRDHLDYHKTFDRYRAAKMRLFDTLLPAGAGAVADADEEDAARVEEIAKQKGLHYFSVGKTGKDLQLRASEIDGFAQRLTIHAEGKDHSVKLPLVGAFQVSNALVAAGLAIVTGTNAAQALAALEHLKGASGRLEFAGEKNGAPIFIDYAHTPDALENSLAALRPYVRGRLAVVFGAGGDRDSGKRPLMGAVAAKFADQVYVTDDNPRSEEPALIRRAILQEAPGATEIGDRAEAIMQAVQALKAGDVLLVAGKGHETGQILRDRTIPYTDHDAVKAALKGEG
ncbi:MAG TPA: UDP-N-acetylmuramoyl-L-alanyl-D-glutamate--2,6-diaminopimelate ligase [Xanthobacteraceae bacterium]|nr:UDP-N-acetylmuramoyl-L-alanyl-D-glutamate--2,6-diaminopimelate ligase [Xanthobacteraceae bacterium]